VVNPEEFRQRRREDWRRGGHNGGGYLTRQHLDLATVYNEEAMGPLTIAEIDWTTGSGWYEFPGDLHMPPRRQFALCILRVPQAIECDSSSLELELEMLK